MSKAKILIVEDQEIVVTQIKLYLSLSDYEVVGVFSNGSSAIKAVEELKPDLILMDIGLEGEIDGIDTAKIIISKFDLPVIYLTAFTDRDIIERAKLTKHYGYLTKSKLSKEIVISIEFALYKFQVEKSQAKLNDEIKDYKDMFELIFHSSKDAIFYLTFDGHIQYWNRTAEKLFKYSASEVLNHPFYDLIIPLKDRAEYYTIFNDWKNSLSPDITQKVVELDAMKKDSSLFPLELTLVLAQRNGKRVVCGFARDITDWVSAAEEIATLIQELHVSKDVVEQSVSELVQVNAQLESSEMQLKDSNAQKDKFFSIIAHDLKNPFQSLLGYSYTLDNNLDSLQKSEIKEFTSNIRESSIQIYKLLENLLHWSQIQRGVINYNPDSFPFDLLIDQNVSLNSLKAKEKGITLIKKVDPNIIALADINMINTVLRNLIGNALKFTRTGGTIEVGARRSNNNEIHVYVKDNGIGIGPNTLLNLFRVDETITTKGTNNESGTGLGLVICKDLVEMNGGRLFVESVEGEGSTFNFTLPEYAKQLSEEIR